MTRTLVLVALLATFGCGAGMKVHPSGAFGMNEAGASLTVDHTEAAPDGTQTVTRLGTFQATANPQACIAAVGGVLSGLTDAVTNVVQSGTDIVTGK